MKKLLNKLLPFLGVTLIVAGLVVGLLTNTWATEAISLLVSGVGSIVLWFLLFVGGNNSFLEKKTTQAATNALVATTAIIVILGLANFLAIRYSYRLDFTENKLYTLAPETQEVVSNLNQPLNIYIFDRQISEDDRALLINYQRYNPRFQFEFIDPDKQVNLTEQFKVKALGEVYLKYGEKKKLVQSLKLGENLSEIQLTNAIVQIQRDRPQFIYFLQGHGEARMGDSEGGFSEAINALKAKGYQVDSLNLTQTKTIPNNANALIIAGAKRKLFPAEIATIKTYLDRGGKLFLTIDPDTETGLESILKDWGVQSENFLVIDASGTGQYLGYGVDTPVVGNYGNHPITKDFGDGLSVYPQSRPIAISKTKDIEVIPLVITSKETWAESNLEEAELTFDPTQDIPGPLNLAVALTRKITPTETTPTTKSNNKQNMANMVIFGNTTFASNGYFQQQLNSDIFINSVKWLADDSNQTLSIRPKQQKNRRINLNPIQAGMLTWTALLVMPLIGLVIAVVMWWRRR